MELRGNIREVNITRDKETGRYRHVRLVFGRHHYINLEENEGRVTVEIGATHHGVVFNATNVGGELDRVIDRLRNDFPGNVTD